MRWNSLDELVANTYHNVSFGCADNFNVEVVYTRFVQGLLVKYTEIGFFILNFGHFLSNYL
jgi:hypothetical protein